MENYVESSCIGEGSFGKVWYENNFLIIFMIVCLNVWSCKDKPASSNATCQYDQSKVR